MKDSLGNAVTGVSVTFTMPASAASTRFNPGNTATYSITTDGAGLATTAARTIKATATAGSYTAAASNAGIATPANFSLTNN